MAQGKVRGRIARAAITAALTGAMALGGVVAPVGVALADEATESTSVSFVDSEGKTKAVNAWLVFKGAEGKQFGINEKNEVTGDVAWASTEMETAVKTFIYTDYNEWLAERSLEDTPKSALMFISERIEADAAMGAGYIQSNTDVPTPLNVVKKDSFAQGLADAIANAGIEATVSNNAKIEIAESVPEGYYLARQHGDGASTSAMWIPLGGNVSQVTIKTSAGTIAKYVFDDSDEENPAKVAAKVADANLGEELKFNLVATIPDNNASMDSFVITDTLPLGMDLVTSDAEGALVDAGVTVSGTGAGESDNMVSNTCFDINYAAAARTLTVTANETGLGKLKGAGFQPGDEITVEYNAKLNSMATKGVSNPNENAAKLTIGSKKTQENAANVYTYQLRINKMDADKDPLTGAKFTVYDEANKKYVKDDGTLSDDPAEIEFGEASTVLIPFMDSGTYTVTEVAAPEGYTEPQKPVELLITGERDNDVIAKLKASVGDSTYAVINEEDTDAETGLIVLDITNSDEQIVLPVTGMTPSQLGTLIGALLIAAGAITIVVRRQQGSEA